MFIAEFEKLVKQGIITAEEAELPDLGEIPEADPLPEEEDEEDEDDDDEDDEDDSDDDGRRKKKRGPALAGNETQGRMMGINQPTQSSERSGAGLRVSIPPWKPELRQF